jgi:hypothetical protein
MSVASPDFMQQRKNLKGRRAMPNTTHRYPDNEQGVMGNPVPADEAAAIENARRIGEAKDRAYNDIAALNAKRTEGQVLATGGYIVCPACNGELFFTYVFPSHTTGKCKKAGCLSWSDS